MPKEASRIFLKIVNVSIDRLQNITESQAECEGVGKANEFKTSDGEIFIEERPYDGYYVIGFKSVWNSTINKKDLDTYGWESNPYVFIYEFEVINI